MIHAARDKWNIDVERSLILGDSDCDEELAAACGARFLRVVDGRIV
jgi:histidinol phosphatase-like enzyme